MSYHKKYIVDGGCPASNDARVKVVSLHLDSFSNEPIYTRTINCNTCNQYYACVFQHASCIIARKFQNRFFNMSVRDTGKELKLLTTPKHSDAVIKFIEFSASQVQKTK